MYIYTPITGPETFGPAISTFVFGAGDWTQLPIERQRNGFHCDSVNIKARTAHGYDPDTIHTHRLAVYKGSSLKKDPLFPEGSFTVASVINVPVEVYQQLPDGAKGEYLGTSYIRASLNIQTQGRPIMDTVSAAYSAQMCYAAIFCDHNPPRWQAEPRTVDNLRMMVPLVAGLNEPVASAQLSLEGESHEEPQLEVGNSGSQTK